MVRAYLDIESLRFGNRLEVQETIDPELSEVLAPPFSLQPLVENAVQHGLQSSATAGRLRLAVHMAGEWLEMSVSDDGQGVPWREVEQVFFGSARGPTRYRCCAIGCKHCSVARFAWRYVVTWARAQQLLCAFPYDHVFPPNILLTHRNPLVCVDCGRLQKPWCLFLRMTIGLIILVQSVRGALTQGRRLRAFNQDDSIRCSKLSDWAKVGVRFVEAIRLRHKSRLIYR